MREGIVQHLLPHEFLVDVIRHAPFGANETGGEHPIEQGSAGGEAPQVGGFHAFEIIVEIPLVAPNMRVQIDDGERTVRRNNRRASLMNARGSV